MSDEFDKDEYTTQEALDRMCSVFQTHLSVANHLVDQAKDGKLDVTAWSMESEAVSVAMSELAGRAEGYDVQRWNAIAVITVWRILQEVTPEAAPSYAGPVIEHALNYLGMTMEEFDAQIMPINQVKEEIEKKRPDKGVWW